jgi:hypothetical protein
MAACWAFRFHITSRNITIQFSERNGLDCSSLKSR